jgi:NADPH-dependent 2,4-dienoyl-CoA reductase/sulfur reductase-like enzyme
MAGRVPEQVSSHFRLLHERQGVEFRFGRTVHQFLHDAGKFIGVVLDDGSEIRAQVALVSVGSVPNTEWLQGSGLDLSNGVVCDEYNRAASGVFAIGDVASVFRPELGTHVRIEHRLTANVHAETVSALLSGADPDPVSTPYFWSDQYETKLQVHGSWAMDCDFEVLEADDAGGWLVGRATRGRDTTAVIGVNAGGRLVRLRRQHLQTAGARA